MTGQRRGRSIDWNTQYAQGRDYTWLPTNALSELLESADYTYDARHAQTALDIGCGSGQLARDLFHRGFKVTGIDASHEAIQLATQSTQQPDVTFIQHDISEHPITGSFDLITCKYVIAFIHNKQTFFEHVAQALRSSKSYFVLISPNPQLTPPEKQHITIDSSELLNYVEHYFETVTVKHSYADIWYICSEVKNNRKNIPS